MFAAVALPWHVAVAVVILFGGVSLLGWADELVATVYRLDRLSALAALAAPVGAVLTGLGVVLAAATWRRHAPAFVTTLGAGTVAMIVILVRALVVSEPLFS
jgi:hypothetical protein